MLGFAVAMNKLDEALSGWALEAGKRGNLTGDLDENHE